MELCGMTLNYLPQTRSLLCSILQCDNRTYKSHPLNKNTPPIICVLIPDPENQTPRHHSTHLGHLGKVQVVHDSLVIHKDHSQMTMNIYHYLPICSYQSTCLFIYLSIYYLFIYLSIIYLSIYLSIYLLTYLNLNHRQTGASHEHKN